MRLRDVFNNVPIDEETLETTGYDVVPMPGATWRCEIIPPKAREGIEEEHLEHGNGKLVLKIRKKVT